MKSAVKTFPVEAASMKTFLHDKALTVESLTVEAFLKTFAMEALFEPLAVETFLIKPFTVKSPAMKATMVALAVIPALEAHGFQWCNGASLFMEAYSTERRGL